MLTDEQLLAVETTGSNIIVSAGAGSGKTKVLTERVITKIKNGIDINELLVLTFTKEAAFEMKDRIRKRLIKEGMRDQVNYIDSAYITTFDSFALSIVRKYHYLLGISKDVSIIDSSIVEIEKHKIIDEIFESMYGNKEFDSFINCYCGKDDKTVKNLVIKLSNKTDLLIDKDIFLDEYVNDYYDLDNINRLKNEYVSLIFKLRDEIRNKVTDLACECDDKFNTSLLNMFSYFNSTNSYDEFVTIIGGIDVPRLPNGSSDYVKELKSSINSKLKKLVSLCKFKNEEEILKYLIDTKDSSIMIIDLVKKLNNRILLYKEKIDKYEFNDIAFFAIKVARENESVRNELKNTFKEIMIDEYQDTNDIQEEFISLISSNNVYVVGDIKQSIYRFRNANPNIFREKYLNYQNGHGGVKIDLLKNFRSRSEVIDTINSLFGRVMDLYLGDADYINTHQMVFGNTNYKDNEFNNNLEIKTYEKDDKYSLEEHEAFIIGNDIKKKIDEGFMILDKESNEYRKVMYTDFCIIMDRSTSFDIYKKIFEYLKLPLTLYKDETLTDAEDLLIIKNIINLVISIHDKKYDEVFKYSLTSVLRSFIFGKKDDYIFDMFLDNKFNDNEAYSILSDISRQMDEVSVYEMLKCVIEKFNIYEKLILKGEINSSIIRYDNILSLAKTLSDSGYTIYDFRDYLNDMIDNNIDLRYSLDTKSSNGIKIMNIHKSKGLEFPICYFSGFSKGFNKDDLKDLFIFDREYGFILPNSEDDEVNPIKELYRVKYNKEDISERIRLFYVALTRARDKIVIVIPKMEEIPNNRLLVEDDIRIKYSAFYDIMSSVLSTFEKYIEEVNVSSLGITKDYEVKSKIGKIDIEESNEKITLVNNEIEYKGYFENKFSKIVHELISEEIKNNMEYGTYIHSVLEMDDLKNPKSEEAKKLVKHLEDLTNSNIYKEYEFIYKQDEEMKHGIIDLMVEYNDSIKIVDYKLSNIEDENYLKQLNGYKSYIESISDKPVSIYLYSINKDELKEL